MTHVFCDDADPLPLTWAPSPYLSGADRWSVCDSDNMRPASFRARLRIIAANHGSSGRAGCGRLGRLAL